MEADGMAEQSHYIITPTHTCSPRARVTPSTDIECVNRHRRRRRRRRVDNGRDVWSVCSLCARDVLIPFVLNKVLGVCVCVCSCALWVGCVLCVFMGVFGVVVRVQFGPFVGESCNCRLCFVCIVYVEIRDIFQGWLWILEMWEWRKFDDLFFFFKEHLQMKP